MQSGDALEEGTWLVQSTQHSDEPQRCLLSQNPELGKRAGNGRPFGVFTVEVPGDVNTTGGAGDVWGVGMELCVSVCVCVLLLSEPRRSIFPARELSLLDSESRAVFYRPLTLGCPRPL